MFVNIGIVRQCSMLSVSLKAQLGHFMFVNIDIVRQSRALSVTFMAQVTSCS